ncbi:MAG: DDE-type integrase/transposase/recombinase, partial [Hymenobacter sp.]|nr:DDE-type integrase/transposase/recombinase [Hymenobacter sp.]
LCAFQDVCSRRVVGYYVMAAMPEELVTTALWRALRAEAPAPGLVVHSDRGGQYCARVYRALLARHGSIWSQSRRGECYDNAQAESLWSRLKREGLEAHAWPVFADLADAQASIAAYFDYYNHECLHLAIGYQTPYLTHHQFLATSALNCPG